MIFEQGVNISVIKQAVYSIPEHYFQGLRYIKFVNHKKLVIGTGFVNGETNLDVYSIGGRKYLQNENIMVYLGLSDDIDLYRSILTHELYHYTCFRDNDIRHLDVCLDELKADKFEIMEVGYGN